MKKYFTSFLSILLVTSFAFSKGKPSVFQADVIIYGGTSAAITAAVQVRKMNKSVIIVSPDIHLGGLSSGGLGWTDSGDKSKIGGLSKDFYHRVWKHYQNKDTWQSTTKEEFENIRSGFKKYDQTQAMWVFEPHVAEKIFEDYVDEFDITVHRNEWLNRKNGVRKNGTAITSIKTLSGKIYKGKIFLDTTYEGDLMASAKVDYHVGRESNSTYGEKWNGCQTGVLHHKHHFGTWNMSPYKIPNDPSSGVLKRISTVTPPAYGEGDHRIQAYCFRMCLTNNPKNRIPFTKPKNYDASEYELLARILNSGWKDVYRKFDPMPNMKTDTNNHGPFSFDNIGMNYDYPEASYAKRREIIEEHETYQKGLLYFIANDPSVPEDMQKEMNNWGLPKDEFIDNGNWSHQLYIREARRMIGQHVMTEHEVMSERDVPQPVGMGSYTVDSHNTQRYITPEGTVQNEGDIGVKPKKGAYKISYGSLLPKKEQCTNLLVPVCVSSSHTAFGSIRMEPVFMILGQSAATAAVMSLDKNISLHDLNYNELKEKLIEDKQIF